MTYGIRFKRSAQKELKKLDRTVAQRLLISIYSLASNSRPSASTELVGRAGRRLRVGDYRVIYTINDDVLTIEIIRVAHRKEVYDR